MPLDSVFLTALRSELCKSLIGAKIEKVQEPSRDELIFSLHAQRGNLRLLISASSGGARVHLTEAYYENPQSPPMFCMLMRKHLVGARIREISQPPAERVLDFGLDALDAMGGAVGKHLILELMGRYSNIILTGEDGIIIDCLRRIGGDMSEKRRVLPGLIYRLPPPQERLYPMECGSEEIKAAFDLAGGDMTLEKWILSTFTGLCPLVCRELAHKAYGDTETRVFEARAADGGRSVLCSLSTFIDEVKKQKFTPCLLSDQDGAPRDFYCFPIEQYGGSFIGTHLPAFSELLEAFYTKRGGLERRRQRAQTLLKNVKSQRDRTARRVAVQTEELKATKGREELRKQGDIITANLHLMKKGMSVLRAADFYSEDGAEREIKLDPLKTPQQNAAKYYKDYTRAKTAERVLTEQIESGKAELDYLTAVIEEITLCDCERDLAEVRQELSDTGYVKKQVSGKKEKRIEPKPMRFKSSTGFEILVGKNNAQNDKLTLRTARKTDVWLHTQKIHGSHVIICGEPDGKTMEEAACLAAYYSQARESKNIPVDYTLVKNVKKAPGGKPGMVIYTDYRTIFVTPDEKLAKKLSVK
ncbi:MAG: NFACT family protein [Oscillospiraceae bacterium]